MKFLSFIWADMWRKPVRTVLMLLSIVNAFLLFGLLQGFQSGLSAAERRAHADILITTSRVSTSETLPVSHAARIKTVPGVAAVSPVVALVATYQKDTNNLRAFAMDPKSFPDVTPAMVVSQAALARFQASRTGALVSEDLAKTYGWRVGDQIPVKSRIWTNRDGSSVWPVRIEGIYTAEGSAILSNALLMQYDYVDEGRLKAKGAVNAFVVRISDPTNAGSVAADIDHLFANSESETKTASELQSARDVAKSIGDVGYIVRGILGAVFFALLLSVGAVMMQDMRERRAEIGVLKAIGFKDRTVLALFLARAVICCVAAAVVGLLAAQWLFPIATRLTHFSAIGSGQFIPTGLAVAVGLAFATGIIPAWQALSLRVADALSDR